MASEDSLLVPIQLGEVGAPHGIAGAVRVLPTTDFPERLGSMTRIWLDTVDGEGWSVAAWSLAGRMTILQLDAVTSRAQAARLQGRRIVVPRSSLPQLPVDSFYWHQLLGMTVRALDGRVVGQVDHVHRQGGAHDFLEVARVSQKPFWIPMVRPMVDHVEVEQGTIWVSLPEGLEDLT